MAEGEMDLSKNGGDVIPQSVSILMGKMMMLYTSFRRAYINLREESANVNPGWINPTKINAGSSSRVPRNRDNPLLKYIKMVPISPEKIAQRFMNPERTLILGVQQHHVRLRVE
jgi:hypothetical protein